MQTVRIYRWRRLDHPGLEVLRLACTPVEIYARSTVLDAGPQPFGLRYRWTLETDWRTRSLLVQIDSPQMRELLIERCGPNAWRVDGVDRADLTGCDEVDLSITPFCNTLAIRRCGAAPRAYELTALYVDLPELTLVPSRQRYERGGPREVEYVDEGARAGFRARLVVDADGMVERYGGLFEMLTVEE